MPYKNKRGGWRVHRSYGVVGGKDILPFDVPIGTAVYNEAVEVEKLLDTLDRHGEHGAAWLLDIAEKRRKPIELLEAFSGQAVKNISTVTRSGSLLTAWERWLKTATKKNGSPISPRTRYDYGKYIHHLLRLKNDATVRDLPDLLEQYKAACVKLGAGSMFNHVKQSALAFARGTEKDKQHSELWRSISKLHNAKVTRVKEQTARPVWEVRAIIEKLAPRLQNVAWALATCGFRIGEYAGEWAIKKDRVIIHGTKTENAVRHVPLVTKLIPEPFRYYEPANGEYGQNWVQAPHVEPLKYEDLQAALMTAAPGFTPNDFRHSYRMWLEEAGIPDLRANFYFGHKEQGLKERYGRTKSEGKLAHDTRLLMNYIQENWDQPDDTNAETIERLDFASMTKPAKGKKKKSA